jgi:hypothetical protein
LELTRKGKLLATQSADFLEREFRILFSSRTSVDLEELDTTLTQVKTQLIENMESRNAA